MQLNSFETSGSSPTQFYTYLWLREDGTPYYVGKGYGRRAWRSHKGHRPPKDRSLIHIQYWQDEATAFAYEIYQIDFWGRKDLGTGCLRNLTDGGEGKAGAILSLETRAKIGASNTNPSPETLVKMSAAQCKRSPETRAKMSAAHMGHKASLETIAKLTGRKHSPETKARISATKTGCKLSPEHRAKLSAALMGNTRTKGYKHSPENLAKRVGLKNKPWSAARRASQGSSDPSKEALHKRELRRIKREKLRTL